MQVFKINRLKAEAPIIATFFIFGLFMSLALFPKILWYAFLVFPLLAIAYYILSHFRLGFFKRQSFLLLDEEGMKYCFNLYQQPRSLLWNQVEKVNYQLYEINFMLKESHKILSIPITFLAHEEDLEEIKNLINAKCIHA